VPIGPFKDERKPPGMCSKCAVTFGKFLEPLAQLIGIALALFCKVDDVRGEWKNGVSHDGQG
jgi:hypothetical protein